MVPDGGSEVGGFGDPELGAAPEGDGVVVEHGRHDECAVEQRGRHRSVPELAYLVAEPAVRSVPQEPLSVQLRRLPTPQGAAATAGGGEGEEGAEQGGIGGGEQEGCWEKEEQHGHEERHVRPGAPPAPPVPARRQVHLAGGHRQIGSYGCIQYQVS